MKYVLVILVSIGLLTAFPAFLCCIVLAMQVQMATAVAQPTSHVLPLSDLLSRGPGNNAHVQVTDFSFGEPVIDKKGIQWQWVWIPLLPAGWRAWER